MTKGFGFLPLLLGTCAMAQAADSGAWIAPDGWPYVKEIAALPDQPTLVVVEENGADMMLVLDGLSLFDSPGKRRLGPELLVLEAGISATLTLQPVGDNLPSGRFRISQRGLQDPDELRTLRQLAAAGDAAGEGSQSGLEAACALYANVASDSRAPVEWNAFARYQLVSCNIKAGKDNDPALLDGLEFFDSTAPLFAYQALWQQAVAAYIKDQYAPALALFQAALSAAERSFGAHQDYAAAIALDMAEIRAFVGGLTAIVSYFDPGADSARRLQEGEQVLRLALADAERMQEHAVAGVAYDFLAAIHYIGGNRAGVIDNLLKAKAEIELTNQPLELLTVLGSIGSYYKDQGKQREALQAYLEAVTIIERLERTTDTRAGDTYHNLATFYFMLGDLPRAIELFQRSIAIAQANGNEWRAHVVSVGLSEALEQRNEWAAAIDLIREAHAFLAAQPETWSPSRLRAQTIYSRLAFKQGRTEFALALSEEILNNLNPDNLPATNLLVPIYVNHARVLLATGNAADAIALLEATLSGTTAKPSDKIEVLTALHEVHAALGNDAALAEVAEAAFALAESQQMEIESVRLGPYWNGRTHAVYASHLEYWLDARADASRAFAVAERARAGNLRLRREVALREQDAANPQADALWQDMLATVQSGAASASEADSLALERNIAIMRERYFAAHDEAAPTDGLRNLPLVEVAASLPTDTMLVQFLGGPTKLWRIDVQNGVWRVTEIGATVQVGAMVDAVRFELGSPNNGQQNLRTLSELLLRDFAPAEGVARLLISPDESMHVVPFSALQYQGGYLADTGSLTVVPSISQYLATAPREKMSDTLELAVLADPAFGAIAAADSYGEPPETFRSWSAQMQRLPASAIEAEALSAYFPEEHRAIYIGARATQENFFSDAVRSADIIHVATHGYFNDAMPELVGLVLAGGGKDDGFVSMAEISTVKFAADLVVISACSTGQGELIPGEGNISLARTFLAQGVNSVISTLWPVSDRATAMFMKEFYRSLKVDGASYDVALQSAQRVLQHDPQYRNPYYWAAFTLTSAVPLRGSAH